MGKRVAVLLMRNLADALQQNDLTAVTSELYWLGPEQYRELDEGVQLLPNNSEQLIAYAQANALHPLGIVIVGEDGDWGHVLIEEAVAPEHRETARRLLHWHLHLWLCVAPAATAGRADC